MSKIVLIIVLYLNLYSFDDFNYKIDVSDENVVIKQAVIISIVLEQKNLNSVMRFDLSFNNSDKYDIQLLESQDSKDSKGRTLVKSKYLLYPLKVGTINIVPKLTIKRASKEELKKFVTGSADELMYLQTRNKSIELNPFELNAKAIQSDVLLVGDYKLDYNIDKQSISSDEQINIEYILSGSGYKPNIDSILGEIANVDSFIDYEEFDKKLFHKIIYRYALKADENFTIPQIPIVGYNTTQKKRYLLKAPSFNIHVIELNTTTKEHMHHFLWEKYLNYLLLFLVGFFIQKLLNKIPQKSLSENEKFIKNVKKSKTPKELLQYLISRQNRQFSKEIEELEMMIYQGREYKLSKIKSSVIERFFVLSEDSI